MGAMVLSAPELQIDNGEAKLLAEAVNAVQEHYNFEASETAIIWTNLIGAVIAVYGPRAMVIAARKSKERQQAKKRQEEKAAALRADPSTVVSANFGQGVGANADS